jgi:acyl-coenzyme A thioesterase PaaI-like protein
MNQLPFQDYMKRNKCWGCGGSNEYGLHIKSYWSGGEAVCTWKPNKYHMAGPTHILNGGIIATIIDCHSICTAIANAYREEGRELNTEPFIWYVTASLKVDYIRPTLLNEPVTLRARVKKKNGRKTVVNCSLISKGEECVRGEVIAVRVSPDWYEE